MEGEFMRCFEAIIHALSLQNFISRLGIVNNIARSLRMYSDNFTAFFLSKNENHSKDEKHMDMKYLLIQRRSAKIKKNCRLIKHIGTNLMMVDPLTKVCRPKNFLAMLNGWRL